MRRVWIGLASLIGAWLVCPFTLADGVMRDGLGARSGGRGGTNIAFADSGTVIHDNPAGMANVAGCGLAAIDLELVSTDLEYEDPFTDANADDDPIPTAQAAYIRKAADGRLSYGIGVFNPAGFGAEYDMQGPAILGGVQRYKSLGMLTRVLPAAAYRVTDRLSVGGTLGVAVSHIELEGPYYLQAPTLFQGQPTLLDLQSTGAAPSWSLGLQYQVTPATTLGLSYQDATSFDLNGSARIEHPVLGDSSFDAELDVTWPRWLGLGVRHAISQRHVVSADVIWFDWSDAFDRLDLRLTNPTDPLYDLLLGRTFNEYLPLDWADSTSLRFGYEQHLTPCHVLRCGYVYHRSPIPESYLTPYLQTTLEHNFTIGFGWLGRAWDTDVSYQYSFDRERAVGDSLLLGGDFDDSRHHSQVHIVSVGFTRRW